MNDQVAVYLTPEEAEKFILFQKYHDVFEQLDDLGTFDILYGKIVMNFAGGVLQNVVKEEVAWKR